MVGAIEFTLNGRLTRVEGCSPNTTLLEYLRRAGLVGSKEGCAEGDCGACSVVLVDRDAQNRPCYRAINSCLVPVCLLAGREIISVEGIASGGRLHPVQEQMVRRHGSQCGYCTPGFVASLFEGYYRGDIQAPGRLNDQLCGNLCRCTGYRPIRDAAISASLLHGQAGTNGTDSFARKLEQPAPPLSAIDYELAGERFFRPTSTARLLELIERFPKARLIAGATELGLEITKRFRRFETLISLEAVPELKEITFTDAEWRIGAAATLTQIEEKMADEFPALGDMLRVFGSRQIRNRATLGGNLATASPIGDSAPVLLALDAHVVLVSSPAPNNTANPPEPARKPRSGNGETAAPPARPCERTLPLDQFFVSYRKTVLQPGEVLKTIIVPRGVSVSGHVTVDSARLDGPALANASLGVPPKGKTPSHLSGHCRWYKVSKRREMDISTVSACFAVDLDARGLVQRARLAYGGVAPVPGRARRTEQALLGKLWSEEAVREVLPVLRGEFTPISDVRGSAEYRRGLVTSLLEKFYFDTTQEPEGNVRSEAIQSTTPPASPLSPLPSPLSPLNPQLPHESAHKHVTGEAIYTDDQTAGKGLLELWPVCSPHAHARILSCDVAAARAMPGVAAVLLAGDIPGENNVGPAKKDEELLADKEVFFHGQIVALVVGESHSACRAAAEKVLVEYEPLPPVLTLQQALLARSFHNLPNYIRRGKIGPALARSPLTLTGTFEMGGQEHFYLETQAAWVQPGEDGSMQIVSSTQHPSEVQAAVAHLLRLPVNHVVVQCPRIGGGFGGKETQAAALAALAALAAHHTRKPLRARWNRDQDMMFTGHRHPFLARFKVGFDPAGRLRAARIHLYSNGGWSMDLSEAVTDRALFHLDNAYYIPAVEFRGQVARTNLSSNTAFRGFGGPQGMLVIEEILDRVARRLGLPPELVRARNLYHGAGRTNTTHYAQKIGDNHIQTIWRQLSQSSDFARRRVELGQWNALHPHRKRGLAITPVKFGISFTVTHLNQAGALVLLYQDGTAQINHGGIEMGQGLYTNITAIASRELGLAPAQVRVMPTSTDKVPNTSATAASCGTDLNGAAVRDACQTLRARLTPVAAKLLKGKNGRPPAAGAVQFADGLVWDRSRPRTRFTFAEVVRQAYLERISLSATGHYSTPGIHWDRLAGRGHPFHYFACGAAATEVEVDGFTGMMQVLRADIVHDVGDPINAAINLGQIEGGYVQGMGWLTSEELKWDAEGRLLTHSPDTYKIPAIGDSPPVFNVTFLENAAQKDSIYGSKAVGEPPLMLAISVREAIRDAIAAFGPPGGEVPLPSPATPEAIFLAIQKRKAETPKSEARK
jgi:xanthine dehydrogenase molybdopterin binding subunit/xanthine dehydrogenase small subunit